MLENLNISKLKEVFPILADHTGKLFLVSRQFIKSGSLRKYLVLNNRVQNITSINNWFELRFKISAVDN